MRFTLPCSLAHLMFALATSALLPAAADESTCRPLPESAITEPGRYCLRENVTQAIHVRSDDVTLDLLGNCIVGAGDPADRNAGVYIQHGSDDIAISNGCIKGFMYGVLADDGASGPRSSRISLTRLDLSGNSFRGALVFAADALVAHNKVHNISGTTVFPDAYAMGLEVIGDSCLIIGNDVRNIMPTGSGEGVGISLSGDGLNGCVVIGNSIANDALSETGSTFGMWLGNGSTVYGNTIRFQTYAMNRRWRTPLNTRANVVIGEQCRGVYYSTAGMRIDTDFRDIRQPSCPYLVDVALEASPRDVYALFRLGRAYELRGDPKSATRYYESAAEMGSGEAKRILQKLRSLAKLPPQ